MLSEREAAGDALVLDSLPLMYGTLPRVAGTLRVPWRTAHGVCLLLLSPGIGRSLPLYRPAGCSSCNDSAISGARETAGTSPAARHIILSRPFRSRNRPGCVLGCEPATGPVAATTLESDSMMQATATKSSADGVAWDLGDLYHGVEDPRLAQDLDEARKRAE